MRITIDGVDIGPQGCTLTTGAGLRIACTAAHVVALGLEAGSTWDVETRAADGGGTTPVLVAAAKVRDVAPAVTAFLRMCARRASRPSVDAAATRLPAGFPKPVSKTVSMTVSNRGSR